MKKNFLIFAILVFITFNSLAQTYVLQFRPWDSKEWGYMNIKGETVIEPQRRKCYDFSEEGLALVYYSKRDHYDIINLNNEVLDVEPEEVMAKEGCGYAAQGFSSGILGFQIEKKWGAIDSKGKIVVPVKYDFLSKFIDGYATARLNVNNNINDSYSYEATRLNDYYYIIDSIGNEIEIKEKDIEKIRMFSEGLTLIQNTDGLMGFVNTKGETVIPLKYKNVGYFKSELAWARNVDGMIGFLNKKGEWAIEPQFLAVKDFDPVSELARARVDSVWGFINKKGEIRFVEYVKKIYDYSEGLAMAVTPNGLFGFLDENQNWIIKPQFDAAREFVNGYAAARLYGKWGIIDKTGTWVIKPIYSGIRDVMRVN